MAEDGLYTGKIVIKSKNSQFKVTIPYRAHVLSGHLFVNESVTRFHLKDRWGFDEEQPNKEHSGSFFASETTDTKEIEDGNFVHNPIGKCFHEFPFIVVSLERCFTLKNGLISFCPFCFRLQ